MKKTLLSAATVLGLVFSACTEQNNTIEQSKKSDSSATTPIAIRQNLISIVEIPTIDLSRAISFYQEILGISIENIEMDGTQMGILPSDEETVSVVLAKGNDYKPTTDGTVVYLNAGDDLQTVLDKIEPKGGKILVPKTQISPEMGFFALFTDTEGNKIGLHSKK
jgi:uncharacterized protein